MAKLPVKQLLLNANSHAKKGDIAVVSRADVFWACKSCLPEINLNKQNTRYELSVDEKFKQIEDSIETKISDTLQKIGQELG